MPCDSMTSKSYLKKLNLNVFFYDKVLKNHFSEKNFTTKTNKNVFVCIYKFIVLLKVLAKKTLIV